MRRFFFTILSIALATPAFAADPAPTPKIAPPVLTVAQAIPLSTALRNLDGHMVVIKQNGADNIVMIPWDFGSGSLRLRIANNLTILAAVEKSAEEGRQAIVREILKKAGGTEIKPGTPEREDFDRQYLELMGQPAPGGKDLARIKASELKLDRNDIPVTALSAMAPLLDIDQ
jgi:hypothetical protein